MTESNLFEVKIEAESEDEAGSVTDSYRDRVIKEQMVIRPVLLQPAVFNYSTNSSEARIINPGEAGPSSFMQFLHGEDDKESGDDGLGVPDLGAGDSLEAEEERPGRVVRVKRSRSVARSRSVTPMRGDRASSVKRQLIMDLSRSEGARDIVEEPSLSIWKPKPTPTKAYHDNRSPKGSLRVSGEDKVALTLRGSVKLLPPERRWHDVQFVENAERIAEAGLDQTEVTELFRDKFAHVRKWLVDVESTEVSVEATRVCRTPEPLDDSDIISGTVSVQAGVEAQAEVEPQPGPSGCSAVVADSASVHPGFRPSTSGMATEASGNAAGAVDDGSELDSEYDDEHEQFTDTVHGGPHRDIPADEELEEPVRRIVDSVERAMDEAAENLPGVSDDFDWSEDFETFTATAEVFSGPSPGPLKDYDMPYDAFIDIWDRKIVEHIAKETNRYAEQTIGKLKAKGDLKPSSRLHRWVPTDVNEIYLLYAIYMLMGLDPRTSQHEFWKTTGYLEMHRFRQLMSYNRFILLVSFLHFTDKSNIDLPSSGGTTLSPKLRNITPVIAHLNAVFPNLYNLKRDVAIDESLTLFKGRLSWVQSIRSKAARLGIKSYELCESNTGYMYKFEIYTGKNSSARDITAPSAALAGKSTQVVLDLLKGLENRGHLVTMDNFYNCPALARYLKSSGFDCLGTLRPNRKNVPEAIAKVSKNVAKGTIVARHCGDVSCIAWKDTKVVNMISTYHKPDTFVGSKAGQPLVKPTAVGDYNVTMGGIDLKDQKLSMYLLERKRCVKWYIKVFKRLLNVSILNAFIMYSGSLKRCNKSYLSHRDFRDHLATSLVERHRQDPILQELAPCVDEQMRLRKDLVHVPVSVNSADRRLCYVCLRINIKKKVHLKCETCDVFLCFGNCWRDWHSLQQLPGRKIHPRPTRRRR